MFHTSSGSFATISTSDISNPSDAGSMIHDNNKSQSSSLQNVPGITWLKTINNYIIITKINKLTGSQSLITFTTRCNTASVFIISPSNSQQDSVLVSVWFLLQCYDINNCSTTGKQENNYSYRNKTFRINQFNSRLAARGPNSK